MRPSELAPLAAALVCKQCLTFAINGQPYAVPILSVQEIRRYVQPTSLPNVPSHMLGVINLRGTVVPVLDLRVRFGNHAPVVDRLTVILVVAVGARCVGLVADDVSKVLSIQEGMLQPSPQLAQHIDISFVAGLVRDAGELVTLLDVERLVADDLGGTR
jgi:purine-binding chemotaxis protein CheW